MGVGGWGSGSGQPQSDINNTPTAQLLPDMKNGQQLKYLTSSIEASLRQCWLEIAIIPNPSFLGVSLALRFINPEKKH